MCTCGFRWTQLIYKHRFLKRVSVDFAVVVIREETSAADPASAPRSHHVWFNVREFRADLKEELDTEHKDGAYSNSFKHIRPADVWLLSRYSSLIVTTWRSAVCRPASVESNVRSDLLSPRLCSPFSYWSSVTFEKGRFICHVELCRLHFSSPAVRRNQIDMWLN